MAVKSKIVILNNTLDILRNRFVWPRVAKEENPGWTFYFYCIIMGCFSWGILNGNWIHFIKALKNHDYDNVDMDVGSLLALVGVTFFNYSFIFFLNDFSKVFQSLSDFEKFGKPNNFDEGNKRLNFFSEIHGVYLFFNMGIIAVSSSIKVGYCADKEVCGMFIQPTMPFDIVHFPGKLVYFALKYVALCLSFQTAGHLSFIMYEAGEHVILRIEDVKEKFTEAITVGNKNQDEDLRKAIDYHNYIIDIAEQLDKCSRQCLFIHMLLTGVILGTLGYLSVTKFNFDTTIIFAGYSSSILVVSHSGQTLIDESVSVGDAVYNTPWYNMDVRIQKALQMVIIRSSRPLYVRAGPFGIMSYALVVGVMKTSYSCLTVLSTTT